MLLLLHTIAFFFISFFFFITQAQQPYQGFDAICSSNANKGYFCSDSKPICNTYSIFIITPSTPSNFTSLFNLSLSAIASANHLPSSHLSPPFLYQPLLIPLTCSCSPSLHLSMALTNYTISFSDTFDTIASSVYGNLTTCKAMEDANTELDPSDLPAGQQALVPLRCACPSRAQEEMGIKFLVTYPVQPDDTVLSLSSRFHLSNISFANELPSDQSLLYPGSTLLLPFTDTPIIPPLSSPSPASKIWSKPFFIIIAAFLFLALALALCFTLAYNILKNSFQSLHTAQKLIQRRIRSNRLSQMWDFIAFEKPVALNSSEIEEATDNFSASSRLQGNVFKGVLRNGRVVAIEREDADICDEIEIMRKLHHVSLLRLVGFCKGSSCSYLVHEYAENGPLNHWLRGRYSSHAGNCCSLTWKQRLQIALDVSTGLEYIHDHTGMGLVHTLIDSSNILLDGDFRAKIGNFGKAKKRDQIITHVKGLRSVYMDPDFVRQGKVTPKLDVFAFGVVLLELLTGWEAGEGGEGEEENGGLVWPNWIGRIMDGENAKGKLRMWIDERMEDAFDEIEHDLVESVLAVAILARSCVYEDPQMRPNMCDIAVSLSRLVAAASSNPTNSRFADMEDTAVGIHHHVIPR